MYIDPHIIFADGNLIKSDNITYRVKKTDDNFFSLINNDTNEIAYELEYDDYDDIKMNENNYYSESLVGIAEINQFTIL